MTMGYDRRVTARAATMTILALLLVAGIATASTKRLPTFVREWGSLGAGNGQFNNPFGIGVDLFGNVYVADGLNDRIQKFSPDGTFLLAWGSTGAGNGEFNGPFDVAVDVFGNVYVADASNSRIQKFTTAGVYVTQWATNSPLGVAVDAAGNVYATDTGNHQVRVFSGTGTPLLTFGSNGTNDGEFSNPYGIAVGSAGNIWVVDGGNNRVQMFTSSGTFVAKWGSFGGDDGQFIGPFYVAVDRAGNVYVTDQNLRIQKFSALGEFRGSIGNPGSGSFTVSGVEASPLGAIYVSEQGDDRILQFNHARMVVGLGNGGGGWGEDLATTPAHGALSWRQVSWNAYNTANGETRPAFCDVDGDGKDELVLGLGNGGDGWLEIKDDADNGFAPLAWIRVNWSGYNGANGETWPACGDVDGDGRDEIVVGLGNGGAGWLRAFDDATTGYAPLPGTPVAGGWMRVPFANYNTANGAVHPAVGNLDGDARDEIVFGLGSGSGGWVHIRDDQAAGFVNLPGTPAANGWLRLGWTAYETENGETWPAIGDLDVVSGTGELVLGLGNGGDGWLRVFQGAAGGFAPAPGAPGGGGWVQINWSAYNGAVGASYPAVGDVDGDGKGELIIGLATYTASGGWIEILDDLLSGLAHRTWARVAWNAYNAANGLTRPAVSH